MQEKFNFKLAVELWTEVYNSGFDNWDCKDEVVHIAAMCGLGVLTCQAKKVAINSIRNDYSVNGQCSQDLYRQLNPSEYAPKWAKCLLDTATLYPPGKDDYPIIEKPGHMVEGKDCFGRARKGDWTDACYRAAWGNVPPYGLINAEKPCPRCKKRLMKYWCWGKQGDSNFRWVIDHVIAHGAGGCVCHFNLQALCPSCNISKGMS
jgi:hypothetical protein